MYWIEYVYGFNSSYKVYLHYEHRSSNSHNSYMCSWQSHFTDASSIQQLCLHTPWVQISTWRYLQKKWEFLDLQCTLPVRMNTYRYIGFSFTTRIQLTNQIILLNLTSIRGVAYILKGFSSISSCETCTYNIYITWRKSILLQWYIYLLAPVAPPHHQDAVLNITIINQSTFI